MRSALPILALCLPWIALGQDEAPAAPQEKKIAALEILPNNSRLKKVIIPRYGEDMKLREVIKLDSMIFVNPEEIAGEKVTIELFDENQAVRGRIEMKSARLFKKDGVLSHLTASESVVIRSQQLDAKGAGLYYDISTGKGFLTGPVTTLIKETTETAMTPRMPSLRATAILGMSLLPLAAAPPPPMTAEEREAIRRDAESISPTVQAATTETKVMLEKDRSDSARTTAAMKTFFVNAEIEAPQEDPVPAPDAPLEMIRGEEDTEINCDGGFYFDAEEGVLVYLKNVRIENPRFSVSGVNELKIFFSKKEKAPKKDADKDDSSKLGGGFAAQMGEVERIVATGKVLLKQKPTGGDPPLEASGAIFSYNLKTDQVVLSGGYPWFVRGTERMRATEPNLSLRLSPKSGKMSTEGKWQGMMNLEQQRR